MMALIIGQLPSHYQGKVTHDSQIHCFSPQVGELFRLTIK
jgi:hypothetical protein